MKISDGRKILDGGDPWESATFEGAEKLTLRQSAAMTFHERLLWIEHVLKLLEMSKDHDEREYRLHVEKNFNEHEYNLLHEEEKEHEQVLRLIAEQRRRGPKKASGEQE